VLTVYTIDEAMHFHIHYMEHVMSAGEAERLVGKAMGLLRSAMGIETDRVRERSFA